MTIYGRSPWVAEFPTSRVPSYPRHRGALDVEVVIVGGGLTGCAAAYAFAAQGIEVALVEAVQLGRGAAGASSGWVGDDPGVPFAALERARGRRAARQAFQAWRRAARDFAALVRRLDLRCRRERRPTAIVALDAGQAAWLARERKARVASGLDAAMLTARALAADTALGGVSALRTRDGATLDPYRACLGLAAAAVARGAAVYERSPVSKIGFDRRMAYVRTAAGSIRARRVVVATGTPAGLFEPLARHFRFERSYFALTAPVPAPVRRRIGARTTVVRDLSSPPHVIRWIDDERLLVAGADRPFPSDRLREKIIVQRTGQLMYELSTLYPDLSGIAPAYGWDAVRVRTADGLPFIGPHRNYPHHLFALGDSSRTVTGAYLASRLLLRRHLGKPDRADQTFEFR